MLRSLCLSPPLSRFRGRVPCRIRRDLPSSRSGRYSVQRRASQRNCSSRSSSWKPPLHKGHYAPLASVLRMLDKAIHWRIPAMAPQISRSSRSASPLHKENYLPLHSVHIFPTIAPQYPARLKSFKTFRPLLHCRSPCHQRLLDHQAVLFSLLQETPTLSSRRC